MPNIEGNADRLQQVFLNLINNAADAMPNGGEISFTTRNEEKHVVVEVSDTGIGMDEATKKRIFEPLFTTKQRGRGTGLGLVVVRQILVEHKAQITVESEKGKGTCFRLQFPVAS
jgi:signal transduction histidine kinase